MAYPATLAVDTPDTIARWRPLVHWLLAIPHYVVAYVLQAVSLVIAVVAWFMIVFTGRVSPDLLDVQAMILRYITRVGAYVGFLHEQYPPFEFRLDSTEPGGTPVAVDFVPEFEARNRLTVGLRFLTIIPIGLFGALVGFAASIVLVVAFFAVIILGRWPDGLRSFFVKALRLNLQINAYGLLITDAYPRFALEE